MLLGIYLQLFFFHQLIQRIYEFLHLLNVILIAFNLLRAFSLGAFFVKLFSGLFFDGLAECFVDVLELGDAFF